MLVTVNSTLEEVHDVEFNETNGSQKEDKNLDDMRGTQLGNAMKMDIGDIRPREVIEVEEDKECKLVVLIIKIRLVYHLKCKINKSPVHHLNPMINQVQEIKCKFSNRSTLQEIIHWTL
jgi:hypothetical protein